MKRFTSILSVIILALSLLACGKLSKKSDDEQQSRSSGIGVLADNVAFVKRNPVVYFEYPENPLKRKPALIYYVVDQPEEALMNTFVEFEVNKLRSICNSETKANWAAFLNSHFVSFKDKFFLLCKDGSFSVTPYNDLIANLVSTIQQSSDVAELTQRGYMLNADKKDEYLRVFKNVPFSHGDVLKAILTFAMSSVFPPDQYIHFVHIKSHGAKGLTSIGLIDDFIKEKNEFAYNFFKDRQFIKEGETLRIAGSLIGLEAGDTFMGKSISQIESMGNAKIESMGNAKIESMGNAKIESMGNAKIESMGNAKIESMGNAKIESMGNAKIESMGNAKVESMGATGYFGLTTDGFMTSLRSAAEEVQIVNGEDPSIAFLMLEACDTNLALDPFRVHRIQAYYAAEGSLWYHNLDWSELIKTSNNSVGLLQKKVIAESKSILNMVPAK